MTKRVVKKGVAPKAEDFDYSDERLPFCCGVTVIGELRAEEYNYDNEKINWSTIPAVVSAEIRSDFNSLGRVLVATTVLRYSGRTNTGQTEVNKVLSRTGWKKVKDFTNRGTGSRLRMWIFTPSNAR